MKTRTVLSGLLMGSLLSVGLISCSEQEESNTDAPEKPFKPIVNTIIEVDSGKQFESIVKVISKEKNSLYVFDIDNTLLITNDNKFGSDWWYAQTKDVPALKLGISDPCLFGTLTPMFYSVFDTKPVFPKQPKSLKLLEKDGNTTIGLTSRGYTPIVASSTELELAENKFDFMIEDSVMMNNSIPLLNGVIYTKGQNKGDALLDYLSRYPAENIYYFDDSKYKVDNVQEAFAKVKKDINLFHMKIAAKVPYTDAEIAYMQKKLKITVNSVNTIGETDCECKTP